MSRVSSTPKRYAGSSYVSHCSSFSYSLTPGFSSYSERDQLYTYRSPTSTSSSSVYSSNYQSSSTARSRNYSASLVSDRDRGRTIPRTDILRSGSSSRRSESLSRTPVKSYGVSAFSGYSSYPAQSSYLASSPAPSSISLTKRKSASHSDLGRDLLSLCLSDESASSSTQSSSTSAQRTCRSRTRDVAELPDVGSRQGCSSLLRCSTQEALSQSTTQEVFTSSSSNRSRVLSASKWDPSSNRLSDSLSRNSKVSPFFFWFYPSCSSRKDQ